MTTSYAKFKNFIRTMNPYVFAALIVFIAFVIKLITPHGILSEIPFLIFFSAVVISGIHGGFAAGIFATLLSAALADYYFLPPTHTFFKGNWHQDFKILLYILDCATMAALCGKLKQSMDQARMEQQRAEKLNLALIDALATRDDFLSIASHEIKTPMTALKMSTQIVAKRLQRNPEETLSREQLLKFLENTERSLQKLNRLVDDMLDVSRLRTGKFALELAEHNPFLLLQDCVQKLGPLFIEAGIATPQVQGDPNLMIALDKDRIEQVITNLLTNSIRYGDKSEIKIGVSDLGPSVRMFVRDHGKGIPLQSRDVIFQRFERLPDKGDIKGLGLGLYISREIVESHRGTLRVIDAVGPGAEFEIILPKS